MLYFSVYLRGVFEQICTVWSQQIVVYLQEKECKDVKKSLK